MGPRLSLVRISALVALGGVVLWLLTFGSFKQEVRLSVPGDYNLPDARLAVLDPSLLAGDSTFVDTRDFRGHVVLVSFWATWCSPCIAEQPSLLALQKEFGSSGLRVVGVLHKDNPKGALDWLTAHDRLALQTLVGDDELARGVRVGGLPHTLLVDRTGKVVELFLGYWPERDKYLRDRVRALLGTA